MAGLRAYLWPLAWALLFHAVALGLFSANWSSPPALRQSSTAEPMMAELLTLVAPAPKPAPKPKAKPRPAPKTKATPKTQKKAAPAPLAEAPAPARPEKAAPERNAPPAAPEPEKPDFSEISGTSIDEALLAEESETSESDGRPASITSYEADINARIVNRWSRPPSARLGMNCDLRLVLVPTGELVSVTLVRSSGNEAFDRSAELAARLAAPFRVPEDSETFNAYFRSLLIKFSPNDLRY